MENNNSQVIAKRLWNILRVLYLTLKKGTSKRSKLMVDLHHMMKHGKIAGKALSNLIIHHHHTLSSSLAAVSNRRSNERHANASKDYEFSCDNTPMFNFWPLMSTKRLNKNSLFFGCTHAPQTHEDGNDEVLTVNAVKKVLEMLNANDQLMSVEASPALPGFGRSPAVFRQLRVTDSPFPLNNVDDRDHAIDKAAEDFIVKFYNDLKKQKYAMSPMLPWGKE